MSIKEFSCPYEQGKAYGAKEFRVYGSNKFDIKKHDKQIRAEAYQQGAKEFAEVIKSRSSEMVQALIDRQLAEWQKGEENEKK